MRERRTGKCSRFCGSINPEIVFLLHKGLSCLLLGQELGLDVEDLAELLIRGRERVDQVKALDAKVAKDFATRPNMLAEVVVEHERERLLLSQLAVQVALEIVHLGLHATKRLHKHVRMALEQVLQVDVAQAVLGLPDQAVLPLHDVLAVLEGHLRELVQDGDHLRRIQLVVNAQVVEQADKVLRLAAQQPTTVLALEVEIR